MAVVTQIQFRRDLAANWTSSNPTLAAGEFGYETDTGKAKIGNGSSTWTALSYALTGSAGTVTSVVGGTGLTGGTITSSGTLAIDTTVVATLTGTQTLTNKTLTSPTINAATLSGTFSGAHTVSGVATFSASPVISTITNTGTLTLPTATDTLVGQATTDTLTNKTLTAPVITYSVNAQTGTTYTPVLSDAAAIITLTNASAIAVTIPPNSSVAYAVGSQINFIQGGAGQVTISGGSGVTIASTGGTSTAPKIRATNAMATAIKTATNTWYVTGDIA